MSQRASLRLAGVSNMPTPYLMTMLERGDVYLRCGADILLNGLKTDLKAEATCPVCSGITRFRITNKRIEDLAPENPVLHVVEVNMGPGRVGVECELTHIFDKKECRTTWLSGYTGKKGAVTSLYDYMDSVTERLTRKGS